MRSRNGGVSCPVPARRRVLEGIMAERSGARTPCRIEALDNDEGDPVIKKLWHILREGDGNRGPEDTTKLRIAH